MIDKICVYYKVLFSLIDKTTRHIISLITVRVWISKFFYVVDICDALQIFHMTTLAIAAVVSELVGRLSYLLNECTLPIQAASLSFPVYLLGSFNNSS